MIRRWVFEYFRRDGRAVEFQNSFASIVVGCVFIADHIFGGALVDRYPNIYIWLMFWPLWVWGWIFLSVGVIHIASIILDKRWLRKQILLIKGSLWVFLGSMILQGETFAPSGYIYLLFAISALFAFLSITINKGGTPSNDGIHHVLASN